MTEMVFHREISTEAEFYEACQDGYEELKQHTGPEYDELSQFEYFASRADGGKEFRSYAHKGTKMFVAVILDRS